jgi:hypothetical protein
MVTPQEADQRLRLNVSVNGNIASNGAFPAKGVHCAGAAQTSTV